jgi:hypothetical protein
MGGDGVLVDGSIDSEEVGANFKEVERLGERKREESGRRDEMQGHQKSRMVHIFWSALRAYNPTARIVNEDP